MRTYHETLWSFRTARFEVQWRVYPSEQLDLSWDDTGETRENLNSGLWCAFDSEMVLLLDGAEIATDWLCESVYENPSDFRDHFGIRFKSREAGCNYGSYFADMVREVCREGRKALQARPFIRAAA